MKLLCTDSFTNIQGVCINFEINDYADKQKCL